MKPAPILKNTVLAVIGVLLLFVAYDWLVPFRVQISYAQIVEDQDAQPLTAFLSSDDRWRFRTELDDISPRFRDAILYKEDRWFRWHLGVNPIAVVRAMWNNIVSGRRTSGASTISMQVARLLSPSERTVSNKFMDMIHAVQLELHYSKDEILRMYLSLVPYGGNIEGVKAASVMYFNKSPLQLSLAEIAALMVIPNRPTSLRLGEDNPRVVDARNKWLRRMERDGLANKVDLDNALAEPFQPRRIATPRMAWHLAVRMRKSNQTDPIIRTTVQRSMQERVESLTLNHTRRLASWGIYNAAVIVVDNRTNNVVAYVGSGNPDDTEHAGQVDGVSAIRSPGSTLKPLLYGMAFDRGIVTPKTMLQDVPINFDGYTPQNYDKHFHGLVSMEQTLAQSLNVPAVSMLSRVGVVDFVDVLMRARMNAIGARRKDLGLSLVLGGCGVRLDELTGLYAAFANDGIYRPLRWITDQQNSNDHSSNEQNPSPSARGSADTTRVISASAAWVVTETLLQLTRPDLPSNVALGTRIPRVAWKTGTSYGRRDAWSIGYNGNYTIGVWVGNFNGVGAQHLSGSEAATPLLFDVFNAIDRSGERVWHQRPKEIDFRLVCSVTGSVPSDSCTDQIIDDFLPGISNSTPCNHVQEMFVSADSKTSYCVACLPDRGYKRATFLNLPAPVLALYRNEHLTVKTPPPHSQRCTRIESDGQIAITAPTANKEYILEQNGESRLQLRCQASADATSVYWYVNDIFLTAAPPDGAVFFEPEGGNTDITVMDDRGRKSAISVVVKHW
ncbi:MAG: penicillin-binding protein 1C [bacterium]|nr:penicillin-binding protein 1C [bacterium]